VARLDYAAMDGLDASTGDVIEIKGKRRTVARCLPLYPSDEGRGIMRTDGLIRNNAGVAIGDMVVVKKIKTPPAEKVVVAPLDAVPPIDERYLADALESVPVMKGDNVMVPYFGGRLTFQVTGLSPAGEAALITRKTVFVISEKLEALRGVPEVTYEDIGGIKDEIQKVREMIELPLRHPEIFEKLGVEAPKGVLRPSGNRQDAPGEGCIHREQRSLHPDRWPGDHEQVLRRVRGETQGDIQGGKGEGAYHRLHRRDRLDSSKAGGGDR
jgi:transitional endoplasmic reticulum ATPase